MATPVLMPRLGQSVESCLLVSWQVKPGDTVTPGQILGVIETDKSSFDLEAPVAGTVVELFFDEGADIPVLTHVAAIGTGGEDVSSLRPRGAGGPAGPITPSGAPMASVIPERVSPAQSTGASPEAYKVSPRARRVAAKHGIDPLRLPGSGPGGRVIERDVQMAAASAPKLSMAAKAANAAHGGVGSGLDGMVLAGDLGRGASASETVQVDGILSEEVVAVKGIRKLIADRMKASLATTAQLTLTRSFDVSAIQRYRARAQQSNEAPAAPKATIGDLLCYALCRVLPRHPDLNAHFLGDKVVKFRAVHLGVAVDTPRGLMVPVVRNAHAMNLRELGASIRALADRCQKGSISPDQLSGGTFTLTNLGAFGVEAFTPVLNVPEVAILGAGGIQLRPVKRGEKIEFGEVITLCLTVDHQVVDGAPAARFLKDLCTALEDPALLAGA